MTFFAPFTIPFIIGGAIMAAVLLTKYTLWAVRLPKEDKRLIRRNILSFKSLAALWEVVRESLLHVRIFRVNPVLGYMHSSLALGWLLLIAVGWIETVAYLGLRWVPLQGHVFFKYFMPVNGITQHKAGFELAMDLLLAVVLSGVALAWIKRMRSRIMGLRRTTKHVLFDRIALSALWFVFPLRYLAESVTCAIYGGGSFLTGSTGSLLASHLDAETLAAVYEPLWWCYSIALGIFFSTMPFSRYMHIFTEIPLIFLRRYRLAPGIEPKSYDHFEVEACSRCGICIDPCQLQSVLGIDEVQSVYFLRDRRYNMLQLSVANNCLMCGRCQTKCPVGINLNTLRLNSRSRMRNIPNEGRFNYLSGIDRSSGEGRTGYFAGCMTMLTPRTLSAMDTIFRAAGDDIWHADRDGGVCCGRPLMLSGETTAARKMIEYNTDLFRRHGITRLVTSCPICLRVFREEYALDGIEVMHHSEYIRMMIAEGRLQMHRHALHLPRPVRAWTRVRHLRPAARGNRGRGQACRTRAQPSRRPMLRSLAGQYGHRRQPADAHSTRDDRRAGSHRRRDDRHVVSALLQDDKTRCRDRDERYLGGGGRKYFSAVTDCTAEHYRIPAK